MMTRQEIPAELLDEIRQHSAIVFYEGAYVDTVICGREYPANDSLCAFCDGTRELGCPTCDGSGFADDNDTPCPTCDCSTTVSCPQSAIAWCH